LKVILIGSGNVATHLGSALMRSKHTIVQVFSRSESAAKKLSRKLKCGYTTDVLSISSKADLYIIALRDEAIEIFLSQFPVTGKPIVHTSGSVSMNVFKKKFKDFGVFYPVQTFSMNREVNFKTVPICLEAGNELTKKKIQALAKSISSSCHFIDSKQRKQIHLAAVFANNFSNHLLVIAENIMAHQNISFDLLRPLILETAMKVQAKSPQDMQTGPAMRGDLAIIREHLKMLEGKPGFKKIYRLISESIAEKNGIRF
jgi:predicted short-subunit dehydrogenase-like oxidoreductase (DUF2520 family)